MPRFPSEEWLEAVAARINDSAAYREAAATWEGDVCFMFDPEPELGVDESASAVLDLWHGRCRGWEYDVTTERADAAAFTIQAPYSRWKQVLRKELDPVKAMMQGALRLKGDLPTIIRHVRAANELVNVAASVPTEFVDEVQG